MAWAVVMAACVCVARADEYGGARMPQYGGGLEYAEPRGAAGADAALDYLARSPDAPAPLDYKYDEESQGTTEKATTEIIESETWNTPVRSERGMRRDRDVLQRRASRRRAPPAAPSVRPARSRARRIRARRPTDYVDEAGYRIDNNHILDYDIDTFTRRETADKIVHRKPRDRSFERSKKSDDFDLPELEDNEPRKYRDGGRRHTSGGAGGGAGYPPADDEDGDGGGARRRPGELHGTKLESVYDYYDEGNVHLTNNKLPALLRRTNKGTAGRAKTARTAGTVGTSQPQTRRSTVDHLLSSRRTGGIQHAPVRAMLRAGGELAPVRTTPRAGGELAPVRTTPRADGELAPVRTTPRAGSEATWSTATVTSPSRTSSESTPALSIADKSRLSILKKAQKKESIKGELSKKPPVLLQVTSELPTIVMVEPPSSAEPWMRAQHVSSDSPEKLERVKRLMRHKLVASAPSIQELMDNWGDMVCDYVDESALDAAGAARKRVSALWGTPLVVFILVIR